MEDEERGYNCRKHDRSGIYKSAPVGHQLAAINNMRELAVTAQSYILFMDSRNAMVNFLKTSSITLVSAM